MTGPVCVISGVGPGTGSALARRFARGGYRVAMLARNAERLNTLEHELADSKAYMCDVSDAAQVDATLNKIESDLGVPTVYTTQLAGHSDHFSKSIQQSSTAIFKSIRWDCFT